MSLYKPPPPTHIPPLPQPTHKTTTKPTVNHQQKQIAFIFTLSLPFPLQARSEERRVGKEC